MSSTQVVDIKSKFDQLVRDNEVLKQERQKVLQELSNLHGKLSDTDRSYADRIGRLDSENKTLTNEYREAQEKLRVSTSQIGKLANDFNEVKQKIEQLAREN
jgi:FtsZ-binding cell division protein ZapB